MSFPHQVLDVLISTFRDVVPIVLIILFFQVVVLRRRIPNLARVIWGFVLVFFGLALFLLGLQLALFPLGESMASQLTENIGDQTAGKSERTPWYGYYWTYLFALAIGISTTIAEPALIAVALKAEEVSGGTIRSWGLRLAVALGVGVGVALGTYRIVTGWPLPYFIVAGYIVVILQTAFAPKEIVPLAYDSGGVTTSTVTVPLVAALGLGLASRVPGANPLIDGFGLIAFASLFPIMSVLGYAQLAAYWTARAKHSSPK